jgi:dTDP-4-amino-4,6-dideoxygalactose transaminase
MKSYLLAERTIDKADLTDLKDWLETDPWLTQGPLVRQFEAAWAAWLGRKHALFVNSGSSANLLMYAALLAQKDLPNRKVIVPAVSWATTVAPAIQLGFEPIMCDADPQTFGLDLERSWKRCVKSTSQRRSLRCMCSGRRTTWSDWVTCAAAMALSCSKTPALPPGRAGTVPRSARSAS